MCCRIVTPGNGCSVQERSWSPSPSVTSDIELWKSPIPVGRNNPITIIVIIICRGKCEHILIFYHRWLGEREEGEEGRLDSTDPGRRAIEVDEPLATALQEAGMSMFGQMRSLNLSMAKVDTQTNTDTNVREECIRRWPRFAMPTGEFDPAQTHAIR